MRPATTVPATSPAASPSPAPVDRQWLQRRTLGVLTVTQMIGGVGVALGITVSALLTAGMGGTALSGVGQSALVVGAAVIAIPATRFMAVRGRRPGLAASYLVGATGATLVLLAAAWGSIGLLFVGLFLFGGGNTANLQSRYAAVDLAEPARRGRQLSFVVWATTVGSVAGPNLAPLADDSVGRFGAAPDSGPFFFSAVAFTVAAVIVLVALRPDPLLTARALTAAAPADRTAAPAGDRTATSGRGLRAAAREVRDSGGARLGLGAMVVGHVVMVAIMAMTPVHIASEGHSGRLRVIGLVISAHIAGMYALSPVTGWLTDRVGRRRVILGGVALLLAACAVAGLSGHHTVGLTVGLSLLGLGWSCTMVAGSTLLSESVGLGNRTAVQGFADFLMGLGGATAGALSGLVVSWSSYGALTAIAAVVTVPLLAAVLRPAPAAPAAPAT